MLAFQQLGGRCDVVSPAEGSAARLLATLLAKEYVV